MFPSILVPLDRSSFAEQALPWAVSIGRPAEARLDLFSVHSLYAFGDGRAPFESDRDSECAVQEQLYLDATARWLELASGISVTATVAQDLAVTPETTAECVLKQSQKSQSDLIVMATHGRGPVARLGIGSVADLIARRANIPVLLVRPREHAEKLVPCPVISNILVPLDGSDLAEQILEPAINLARLLEAQITLVSVVESPANTILSHRPQAEHYLNQAAVKLQQSGLVIRSQVVAAPTAAEGILKTCAGQNCQLLALSTRGYGGLKRMLLGSVADQLIRSSPVPVFLFHSANSNAVGSPH